MKIPQTMIDKVIMQAEKEYPKESCGMILGPGDKPGVLSTLRPCRNVQDEYHVKDTANFPRTARTGYFMEPADLFAIQKEARSRGETIRVIYHSHIDTGAYFSEEDKRAALASGEPAYPDVQYLVISVLKGKVGEIKQYSWDPKMREFAAHD